MYYILKILQAGYSLLFGWQLRNGNFSATKNHRYLVDCSSSNVLVTLPSSAILGDEIQIEDGALSWGTNSLTLLRNGLKINGSEENYTSNTAGDRLSLIYIDTSHGWDVKGGVGAGTGIAHPLETPNGLLTTFTFSATPKLIFRNGVMENRLGSFVGNTFIFNSPPSEVDDIEGLL